MELRDVQYIRHMLDYCVEIQDAKARFGNSFQAFLNDRDYQKSISFSILQIGELSNRLSMEYRGATIHDIPWKSIIGMRNVVVHDYGHIEYDILWDTISNGIPALQKFCEEQLDRPEAKELLAKLDNLS